MHRLRLQRSIVAMFVLFAMLCQGTWVLAGTTGGITGVVSDTATGKPIAQATVTVLSPSQTVKNTTDSAGRFTFLNLAPDTYTISVTAAGHTPSAVNGVTVVADQTQTVALTSVSSSIVTIGRTQSRVASDIVKAGQTSDVYSVNAAQAAAAAPLGGGGSLNQAYSAVASVPGVFVPLGQEGWAQSVYIRGGNYTQVGYDYDGVPVQRAYDAYPSSTLSALGQQEIQVYTGSAPGDAQSNGLAGFINQVIKTGTYPGSGTGQLGFGTPTFYHKAQLEIGGSTPDRNFSYYVAGAGYDQSSRVLDQFDGTSQDQNFGEFPYAIIVHNCGMPNATAGCYSNGFGPVAPNGYIYAPLTYGEDQFIADRETVANLHIGIPHKNDGLKDDIQILGSDSYLTNGFNDSYNAYGPTATKFFQGGPAGNVPACTSALLAENVACAESYLGLGGHFNYTSRSIYTGPTGTALTSANLGQVSQYLVPSQPTGLGLGGVGGVDPDSNGTYQINDAIFKLQYTHAMGANAYARIYGYTLYSSWIQNDPNGSSNPFAFVSQDYILPTHTKGLGITLADQVGNHLLNLTGGYSTADLLRWNNSLPSTANPVAVLVNSANPTSGCYSSALTMVSCTSSSVARYTIPASNTAASNGLQAHSIGALTLANVGGSTCGTGACEFLTVSSGLQGSYNDVTPRFANLSLSDTWNVTPKFTANLGVRYDSFRYDIPSATSAEGPNPQKSSALARTLFTNSFNMFNCYDPAAGAVYATATADTCADGGSPTNFTNNNQTQLWFGGFEPRVGLTYKLDNYNVLRANAGKYLQPSSTAYTFYNRASPDLASFDAHYFYGYGYTSAEHSIPPEVSYNYDFSFEHQIKGTDLSFSVTPFYRKTQNEDVAVILDPVTLFSSAIPGLASTAKGVEFYLRKGDFNRNGFAAQVSYTYTYETSKYQTLPGGNNALSGVNSLVTNFNAYTSTCANNPTHKGCGTTASGVTAAPCYTAAGAPDTACAAGSIANPYWNSPVQPLFDSNASYYPYNETFTSGFSSNASSYNIPHIAALILNYKHNKLAITPTFQLEAGGRYGSPVQGIGIEPDDGACQALNTGTVAGDPRYPYGAPGGSPYDAQTCAGYLVAPDPVTHKFDAPGAFVEPTQLLMNLQVTYQATKRLSLNATAVNIYGTCFGGSKEPWRYGSSKTDCWYGAASGLQAGNFYNPGNTFQHQANPYFPVVGDIAGQTVYGTAVSPFNLYVTASYKM